MTTLALGVDPGPTKSGWARVFLDPKDWLCIDYGAHLPNDSDDWRKLLGDVKRSSGVLAIEQIHGYAYEASRVAALVETSRFEGRVLELARFSETRLLTFTNGTVRGELCRMRQASDEQVRIVLAGITRPRAPFRADEQVHIYDAAAAAALAIIRTQGINLQLPPAVSAALHMQQLKEKGARERKKATGGAPPEKRSLTREQRGRRKQAAKDKAWAVLKGGA